MKGASDDPDPEEWVRRDRYRYRQELVLRRRPRWAWRHRAAAEVVAWPDGDTARQHAGLPDRHGGLCRCPSSEPPAQIAWPRCPADAGEVRARLLTAACCAGALWCAFSVASMSRALSVILQRRCPRGPSRRA